MAALDLTDRAAVLAYLVAQLPDEDSTILETMLDASAGYTADDCDEAEDDEDLRTTFYRPWWIIGNVLRSNPNAYESVRSAAGSEVVYSSRGEAMRALAFRQTAFDAKLCAIPEGFEVVAPGAAGSAQLKRVYRDE